MTILSKIEHIVVVMFENRSLDHMLGWLYPPGTAPAAVLPRDSTPLFDGLTSGMSNPLTDRGSDGQTIRVAVTASVDNAQTPNPDPQETFANVAIQEFGTDGAATAFMQGFVDNYATTGTTDPSQIMQCHSVEQLPVLSTLARSYAVSDAWFCSVPSQTWPNRAFVHAGTSNGRVDNGHPADPLRWDVPTIFNVFKSIGATWSVYSDSILTPSLTRTMFPKLWDPWLTSHFKQFTAFVDDCANNTLPQYSFIEPSFIQDPNDQHPPHDVNAGEAFLHAIWMAVSSSPGWKQTLLIVTFDEHGGCYDHVPPPFGCAARRGE